MLQSVLDAALTAEQRKQGFSLYEPDDHILVLRHQGIPVAFFSQGGATVASIRKKADEIAMEQLPRFE